MLILPTTENLASLRAAYQKLIEGAATARSEYDTESGRRGITFFKGDAAKLETQIKQMDAALNPGSVPKPYGTLRLRTSKGL